MKEKRKEKRSYSLYIFIELIESIFYLFTAVIINYFFPFKIV